MTIIVHDKSNRLPHAYRDYIPHPNGRFQSEAYVCGDIGPHYLVPAIIEYFEYGRELYPNQRVILIHVKAGRF